MAGAAQAETIVQFDLNGQVIGPNGPIHGFQVELFDDQAPITVANFLHYVTHHDYDSTIIHRSVQGFVVQGGGFAPLVDGQGMVTALVPLATYGKIQNEYSPTRSNVRGTIAMAKVPGDPNSATDQWFINLGDNSANLDNQNGGFTVFGRVLGDGMTLIDAVGGLPTYNLNPWFDPNYAAEVAADPINGPTAGPFATVPLFNNASTFVAVTSVIVVPEPSCLVLLAAAGVLLLAFRRRAGA
jgi:cyclophilin family peptidyl-prolyl cis-trans isomerase